MSDEAAVRAASDRFYAALTSMCRGDSGSMADAWWAEDGGASTMHPIGGREIGVDAVLGSFGNVAKIATAGHVAISDQIIRVNGDTAWEMGQETGDITMGGHGATIDQRVTNVYARRGGEWRMVHHHADISPAMMEVLAKLQAG